MNANDMTAQQKQRAYDNFHKNNPSTRALPPEIDVVPMPDWYETQTGTYVRATPTLHSMRKNLGLKPWEGEGLPPGLEDSRQRAKEKLRADIRAELEAEMRTELEGDGGDVKKSGRRAKTQTGDD